MKRLFLVFFVSINSWGASLGIPNLQISATANKHSFINSDSTTTIDSTAEKIVQQQISNFSAQVRGKIIQSKYFQVVDISSLSGYTYLNSKKINLSSKPEESAIYSDSKQITPDYLLTGTVSAIDAGEEVHPVPDTNRYSLIYSIDIVVDYKLIRTKDNVLVSSFTAAGHGGDVKLTTNQNQKMNHNIPKLVQQVGDDLANDVNNQLTIQLENGKIIRDYQEAMPTTTDLKVHTNAES